MILAQIAAMISFVFGVTLIASLLIENKNIFIFNRTQTVDAIFVCVCVLVLAVAYVWYETPIEF